MGKGVRGSLNASHYHDWIRHIHDITTYLWDAVSTGPIQYLNTQRTYPELMASDIEYVNKFVLDTIDSDYELSAQSDEDNRNSQGPTPVDDSEHKE